ncbi:MAG: carbohydrate-binding protein, partial [Pedobacter sp.]
IKGSSGVWGEVPMPAHPAMKETEVKQIVEWILSLSAKANTIASLPTSGKIMPPETVSKNKSVLTLKASYSDLGSKGLRPLTTTNTLNLRNNVINSTDIKSFSGFSKADNGALNLTKNTGWLKLSAIDLTNLASFEIVSGRAQNDVNYEIELRLDSENGKIIGKNIPGKSSLPIDFISDGKFHNIFLMFKSNQDGNNGNLTIRQIVVESK